MTTSPLPPAAAEPPSPPPAEPRPQYPPGVAEPQFPRPFPAPVPPVDIPADEPPAVRPGMPAGPTPEPPPETDIYSAGTGGAPGYPPAPAGYVAGPPAGAAPAAEVEQSIIMPTGDLITLTSGTKARIKPLRTRELLALVNIGVCGIGPRLGDLNLDPDSDPEVFMAQFAGLVLTGLGTAEDEACAFLRKVCEPAGKVTVFKPDKAQRLRNKALDEELDAELANPDPDDTITIIEKVVEMNSGDLQAWGKRLAGIWRLAKRTGQIPASPTSPASSSSAA